MGFQLAVVLLAYVAICSAQGPQPVGRFTIENVTPGCQCTKYEFFCDDANSERPYQQKAAELCATRSVLPGHPTGRLAVLRNASIDQLVRDYIIDNQWDTAPCINRFGFWFGLGDPFVEGEYTWSDGQSLCSEDFRNWAPEEPDNNDKKDGNGQDCAQLWFRKGNNGLWDDEYCDARPKGIVCEIPDPYCHSQH